MKRVYAVLITGLLVVFIAQAYVGLGLGQRLTLLVQALLWGALAFALIGLVAGLKGLRLLALSGWVLAGLVLVWLQMDFEASLAPSRATTSASNRSENEQLLAKALARVPCGNGDTATLQMFNNRNTDRYSLSIQIVPADPGKKGYILVSTSGEYKPPDDEQIRSYRTRNQTDCRNAEYPSLDAMMGRLRTHYAAERHKYSK